MYCKQPSKQDNLLLIINFTEHPPFLLSKVRLGIDKFMAIWYNILIVFLKEI